MKINWTSKNCFTLEDVNFKAIKFGLPGVDSTLEEFIFQKPSWMVERYGRLICELEPKRIFELGIWKGGSSVFFHKIAEAEKLITIDISEDRIAALDDYIRLNDLKSSLKPMYGIDQSDIGLLRQIVSEEFDGGELDLVVDDASHYLDETRNSFNAIFPFVRPGGVYVIEDWPWAHGSVDLPDDTQGFYPEREPLTKLVFELILACASTNAYIEKMEVDRNSVTVWRGEGSIEAEGFDIAQCCLARGRDLIGNGTTND
jgi:SAM-dependent methyltransferase